MTDDADLSLKWKKNKKNDSIDQVGGGEGPGRSEPDAALPPMPPQDLKEFYYDMSKDKILIVFNHYIYQREPGEEVPAIRNGTHADVDRLQDVFGRILQFRVDVHNDKSHGEILDILNKEIKKPHKNTSCIAVAILTHGGEDGMVEAKDQCYPLTDVFNKFFDATNTDLVTKPKLFFVQACRGEKVDSGRVVRDGGNDILWPTHIDYLMTFSSYPGYMSWKNGKGSWLIQELCNAIVRYHNRFDLLQIITIANKEVARRITNTLEKETKNKKIVPITEFTLTKMLRFD